MNISLKNISIEKAHKASCFLLLFFLPINEKISTILIVISVFLTLLNFKNFSQKNIIKNWPLIFFYFAYIILGSLLREFYLIKHLEYKLSFIFLPLIFHNSSKKDIIFFFKGFVYGLIFFYFFIFSISLSHAFKNGVLAFTYKLNVNDYGFIENGIRGGNYFLGDLFTRHLQSSYFSLYYSFGIVILNYFNFFSKKYNTLISILFCVAIIQSMSKAGIILVIIVFLSLVYKRTAKKRAILFFLPVLILTVYFVNPRFKSFFKSIIDNGIKINKDSPESVDMRLMTWDAAIKTYKNKPLIGHGVVTAQTELNKTYLYNTYKFPLLYRLNSHNTYLQILLEGGLVLLLIFLLIQFRLLYKYGKSELVLGFTILCFISFTFESYFSRYLGISFFALFYTLLLNYYENEKE